MNTMIDMMKNWRVWAIGLLVSVAFLLLIAEGESFAVFMLSKAVGIAVGLAAYACWKRWHETGKLVEFERYIEEE